jgi:hypothetical protein
MADVVTFDPVNLRIVEISTGGDNELDLVEIYSEWKDWLLADPLRLGFPPAFREVGGDPISLTQSLGTTFFLLNGWRIRPAESHHKLTIVGNVFTEPAGESVFVPTFGAFTVNTETRVSNLIDMINTGGDPVAVANAVWAKTQVTSDLAGTMGQALLEIFRLLGLDPTRPLISNQGAGTQTAGGTIALDIVEAPPGVFTATRQP